MKVYLYEDIKSFAKGLVAVEINGVNRIGKSKAGGWTLCMGDGVEYIFPSDIIMQVEGDEEE